jgi:hypothetical protein
MKPTSVMRHGAPSPLYTDQFSAPRFCLARFSCSEDNRFQPIELNQPPPFQGG